MNDKLSASLSTTSSNDARSREILKARARALARPLDSLRIAGDAIDVVEFHLAKERYAVEQSYVREVQPLKDLTLLPCTPNFIRGVVNLRGQILPVIDIKKFFDLPESGITDIHMVIVVRSADVELGILADAIDCIRSIPLDSCQPSLPTLTGIREKYLKAVTNEHLVILDVAKIMSDPKLVVEQEVAQ
jgi:purine-binding chemotaxis protein CheW